jgi:FkbM family methyltransferase
MSSKLKGFFDSVVNNFITKGNFRVAGYVATLAVSIADKRYTKVKWDGEDWEFKWFEGNLYWDSPLIRVKSVSDRNMGLFLANYSPNYGDVIFDVGAGAGTEVGHFSRLVGPEGKVYAIEADPSAARRLRKQVSNLKFKNVEILQLAVGMDEGIVHLSIAEEGGIENSIKSVVGSSSVEVACKRLDDIIENLALDHISYMKINIEGAEHDALIGLGTTINKIENFCISCHDFTGDPSQATFDQVKAFLNDNGLKISTRPNNPDAIWENYYLFARK